MSGNMIGKAAGVNGQSINGINGSPAYAAEEGQNRIPTIVAMMPQGVPGVFEGIPELPTEFTPPSLWRPTTGVQTQPDGVNGPTTAAPEASPEVVSLPDTNGNAGNARVITDGQMIALAGVVLAVAAVVIFKAPIGAWLARAAEGVKAGNMLAAGGMTAAI